MSRDACWNREHQWVCLSVLPDPEGCAGVKLIKYSGAKAFSLNFPTPSADPPPYIFCCFTLSLHPLDIPEQKDQAHGIYLLFIVQWNSSIKTTQRIGQNWFLCVRKLGLAKIWVEKISIGQAKCGRIPLIRGLLFQLNSQNTLESYLQVSSFVIDIITFKIVEIVALNQIV